MIQTAFRRAARPLAIALLLGAAMPAAGQLSPYGYGAETPSAALGRHLRTVVSSPRNLEALRGAGRAALELGDLDAAVGFLARAEEVAPRDGRTKAGLGSAFTMLQQPGAALRYFSDAVSLGVPAIDVAADRGLAHDLRGNWRAAQRDYKLVLASRPDPEVTRRLAVSQAAGGDEKTALATLDPQVRAKDAAAWRVRAFILAMGGDASGAQKAVAAVLPAATANGFAPYFRRMSGLSAGQKVAAAQFGSMPGETRTIRMADLMTDGERAARVALESVRAPTGTAQASIDAGRPDVGQTALGRRGDGLPVPTTRSDGPVAGTLAPVRVAEVAPRNPEAATPITQPSIAQTRTSSTPVITAAPNPTPAPVSTAVPQSTSNSGANNSVPAPALPAPTTIDGGGSSPVVAIADVPSGPVQGPPASPTDVTVGSIAPAPVVTTAVSAPPASQPKVEAVTASSGPPPAPRPKVEQPVARTVAALRASAAAPRTVAERPSAPRHYVQVGIGQDLRALQNDWRRLRTRHTSLLGGQDAWTVPLNKTNRLLVGPFPSAAAAQAFVNRLAAGDVSANRFSSEPGQEVSALR